MNQKGKKKMSGLTGSMYVREIPALLANRFRAACVLRGSTIRKEIIKFLKAYVDESEDRFPVNTAFATEEKYAGKRVETRGVLKPKRKKKK